MPDQALGVRTSIYAFGEHNSTLNTNLTQAISHYRKQ